MGKAKQQFFQLQEGRITRVQRAEIPEIKELLVGISHPKLPFLVGIVPYLRRFFVARYVFRKSWPFLYHVHHLNTMYKNKISIMTICICICIYIYIYTKCMCKINMTPSTTILIVFDFQGWIVSWSPSVRSKATTLQYHDNQPSWCRRDHGSRDLILTYMTWICWFWVVGKRKTQLAQVVVIFLWFTMDYNGTK